MPVATSKKLTYDLMHYVTALQLLIM